jgi:phospholipid N-methyltransferase
VAPRQNIGRFFGEFLLHPAKTGAIAPSSQFLARTMVEWIDLPRAKTVFEYGPGTGVFTSHILKRMPEGSKFVAIELNRRLAGIFRQRHPNVILIEDSVTNVDVVCQRLGIANVDCVVCGLPWASFPESLQIKILDQMISVMSPEGQFVSFAYLQGLLLPPGRRFAKILPQYFRHVSRSRIVWRNLPPAFVYRCQR